VNVLEKSFQCKKFCVFLKIKCKINTCKRFSTQSRSKSSNQLQKRLTIKKFLENDAQSRMGSLWNCHHCNSFGVITARSWIFTSAI